MHTKTSDLKSENKMSSSSTTTTTKNVANVAPAQAKATPNSGGHTVKIPTSAELKLELKTLWNGSDAKASHRKQLAKAAEKHNKWLDEIIGDVTDEMNEEVKKKVLMETMAEMEDQSDGWWLLETCFNMMDDDADFAEFTDRLRDAGLDFIDDDNDLALVFDHLEWYRDDRCGCVDSRKVLQAAVEWIEAGNADDAMVQLYNNLTGYANDHDFPDTELGEALNDPKGHPGVKLPVVETSKGLLWWCDKPDAFPMVVRYKGKRYDAGLFQLSKLPLDVLEDPVDTYENTNGSSSSKPKSVAPDALEQLRQRAWKFFKTMLDAYKGEHGKYPSEEGDSWYLFVDKLIASGHFQSLDEFKQIMGQVMKWGVLSGALDDRNMYEETPHEYPFWVGWPEEFHTLLRKYDKDEYRRYAKETGTAEVDGDVSIPPLPYCMADLYKCGGTDKRSSSKQIEEAQAMWCARQRAKNLADGFQFHEEHREKPLKRSAPDMDSNGSSMPAWKRSKSVAPPLKRSASMDSNGVEDAAKQDEVDLNGMPMVYDRPIRFCRDCLEKDHPAGAYDKRCSHTCHLCPNDAEYYDFEYVMNDYNRGGTTLRHGYKCRERCGNACVVKEFDKESYMYNPRPGWVYSNVYSNGFRCFKCRGKEDSLGPEQENFD